MAETDSDEGKSDNKHAGEYTEKKRSKTKLVQLATPSVHKFKFIQLWVKKRCKSKQTQKANSWSINYNLC